MGFGEAVKSFYRRYVDFQGRSARSEYWWVQLYFLIVYAILFALMMPGLMASENGGEPGALFMIAALLFAIFALANILPAIAVTVRRFHDQDKSGWFYLLAFIPYVGGIIIIIFMCLKGTSGPNRFGPDPLGHDADVFS